MVLITFLIGAIIASMGPIFSPFAKFGAEPFPIVVVHGRHFLVLRELASGSSRSVVALADYGTAPLYRRSPSAQ